MDVNEFYQLAETHAAEEDIANKEAQKERIAEHAERVRHQFERLGIFVTSTIGEYGLKIGEIEFSTNADGDLMTIWKCPKCGFERRGWGGHYRSSTAAQLMSAVHRMRLDIQAHICKDNNEQDHWKIAGQYLTQAWERLNDNYRQEINDPLNGIGQALLAIGYLLAVHLKNTSDQDY